MPAAPGDGLSAALADAVSPAHAAATRRRPLMPLWTSSRSRSCGLGRPVFPPAPPGTGRYGSSRLRGDWRADDRDLGDRKQRPLRGLDAGRLGARPRPVALEARGRADEHVGGGRGAGVRERGGGGARREGELTRALGVELVLDLEDQLALEDVELLVEVVSVQRR